ncbi:hypothetical protein An04g10260 [Aspergillus niger]|uniref:Uncharacterized protein n=2 Tax=Aspergillus niger TaxID=5061 RepID=A2QKD7_ASPNC|nr:hypothetical protein An04g10260 [Aspergillus niger]CAK44806.1 hypothetical protein An04g10260 [Aspergillus niger]
MRRPNPSGSGSVKPNAAMQASAEPSQSAFILISRRSRRQRTRQSGSGRHSVLIKVFGHHLQSYRHSWPDIWVMRREKKDIRGCLTLRLERRSAAVRSSARQRLAQNYPKPPVPFEKWKQNQEFNSWLWSTACQRKRMIALAELETILDTSFILPEAQKHWISLGPHPRLPAIQVTVALMKAAKLQHLSAPSPI